jgi:hypothetical protein
MACTQNISYRMLLNREGRKHCGLIRCDLPSRLYLFVVNIEHEQTGGSRI